MKRAIESDLESIKAEEGGKEYLEGGKKERLVNLYERNPKLRIDAINLHGKKCKVCSFDFEQVYGERGRDYIEVHHLRPISNLTERVTINPANDMTVLCSNCHRMIHRDRDNILSPKELRQKLRPPVKIEGIDYCPGCRIMSGMTTKNKHAEVALIPIFILSIR